MAKSEEHELLKYSDLTPAQQKVAKEIALTENGSMKVGGPGSVGKMNALDSMRRKGLLESPSKGVYVISDMQSPFWGTIPTD